MQHDEHNKHQVISEDEGYNETRIKTVQKKAKKSCNDSERLTFGCATPPIEEQKIAFIGDNSLSPVRAQNNDKHSS